MHACACVTCILPFLQIIAIGTFFASGIGGGGNEQESLGKVPSSMPHCSTLKHLLQLMRRDLLPFPLLSGLNPPKRGAPGVPGVAGVEGADGTSSFSITPKQNKKYILKIIANNQKRERGKIDEFHAKQSVLGSTFWF